MPHGETQLSRCASPPCFLRTDGDLPAPGLRLHGLALAAHQINEGAGVFSWGAHGPRFARQRLGPQCPTGTLILRDLELLRRASRVTDIGVSVSVGFTDPELWRTVEPGTPSPQRRLEAVRTLTDHGIPCGVLMAQVIPFLGDSPEQLRATVRAVAAAGATSVTPLVLHLRPGAREWFTAWLARHHPRLLRRYDALYGGGTYVPRWYQRRITGMVHEFADEYGIGPCRAGAHRGVPDAAGGPNDAPATADAPDQLTLL